MGGGSPHVPGAGAGGSCWRPVAAPLALRQHGVGVGLLLQHEPPVPPALGAAAHPVEDPELAQPLQRRGDGAHADAGLAGDRRVGRVQAAGAVVQEVEDQRVQHRRARCGRRRRRGGQAGACRGRSRGRGARGARRPSWASAAKRTGLAMLPDQTGQGARVGASRAGIGSGMAGNSRRKAGVLLGCAKAAPVRRGHAFPRPQKRRLRNGPELGDDC